MRTKNILAVALILVLVMTLAVGCGGSAGTSSGEIKFPEKSMDMTILFQAGGAADVIGRQLAEAAAKDLGQPIVCNVRTGGGGAVGYQYVLGTKPDGYNMVWNSTSICVTYHQGNMPKGQDYSAFRGVAKISDEASVLAVKADSPWQNLEDFIQYAKDNPGKATVTNAGVGSFNHLTAVAVEDALGVKFNHIPMDSKASVTTVLGGNADAMVNMAFDAIPHVQAGEMRALAVIGTSRLEQMPDVPTLKELGYDVDLMMWRGIAVPKDTPDEVVLKLQDAFLKAAESESFKNFCKQYSVEINTMNAADFDKFMAEQDVLIADLMEKIGLKNQ
ncbi:MAG: tripartite tricarboxylate transporter substrate binding protein [Peptococcaceae bacterium]|jgi:tripartite-type tricarboxylate transporter receptor subunit TctC|nr:tripartite tricarboxylate transporter substrate binding protein [Peptococcaceae bacterium]